MQPGTRVAWTIYDTLHFGTVVERFNSDCILIDRGRTYTYLGVTLQDIDVVAIDRLQVAPEASPEPADADDQHELPVRHGKKRKSARMRKWRSKT